MGKWLNVKQAADFLGVSEDTVDRERKAGRIKAYKIRRLVQYLESDLKAYLEENSNIKQGARA